MQPKPGLLDDKRSILIWLYKNGNHDTPYCKEQYNKKAQNGGIADPQAPQVEDLTPSFPATQDLV